MSLTIPKHFDGEVLLIGSLIVQPLDTYLHNRLSQVV